MKKTLNILFLLTFLFLLATCNSQEKKESGLPVIPVDLALNQEETLYLKDYVSDIHYVRLSTTEDILIQYVSQMYYDGEKNIILDMFDNCKIFDKDGNFKFSIGKVGQGPGEYVMCRNFDLIYGSNQILLFPSPRNVFVYNMDGNFLKRINTRPFFDSNAYFSFETKCLSPDIFISDIFSSSVHNIKCLVYNDSIIKKIPSYLNIPDKNEISSVLYENRGILYRFKNDVIHYKPLEDTIFRINTNLEYEPYFGIEYGKYKLVLETENNYLQKIKMENIQESDHYMFLEFILYGYKNAFEYINEYGRKTINNHIYGLFDKENGKLNFLRHPEPGKLGFKNDVDDGLPFWPKYISPKGEMITYYQPYEFMDVFQNKGNVPDDVKAILKDLKEDDNPIVAIAKLK